MVDVGVPLALDIHNPDFHYCILDDVILQHISPMRNSITSCTLNRNSLCEFLRTKNTLVSCLSENISSNSNQTTAFHQVLIE